MVEVYRFPPSANASVRSAFVPQRGRNTVRRPIPVHRERDVSSSPGGTRAPTSVSLQPRGQRESTMQRDALVHAARSYSLGPSNRSCLFSTVERKGRVVFRETSRTCAPCLRLLMDPLNFLGGSNIGFFIVSRKREKCFCCV